MVRAGRYRHYKGKYYQVIGCAKHTETGEELVVYRALYGGGLLWIRPKEMFLSDVSFKGQRVPRFRYVASEAEHEPELSHSK